MAAWIAAWLVNIQARAMFAWGTEADTVYWMIAKVIVWVLPVIVFIKRREREPVADYLSLRNPARGVGYGAAIGLAVLAASFLLDFLLGGAAFYLPVIDLTFVSSAVVTPFAEEWALRGLYYSGLTRRGMEHDKANNYAAYVFVAMYLPGWYFQGRLREPLGALQPAIFLWLLGLVLGWSRKKSGTLYTPMVVHALNNLYVAAR